MIYEPVSFWTLFGTARPMLEQHARDFAIGDLDSYIGDPDEMMGLETSTKLVVLWARDEDAIQGYLAWMLAWHQGLKQDVARLGPWFVLPEVRGHGVGTGLFTASLDELRRRSIRYALPTVPMVRPEAAPAWLRRLGASAFEVTCIMDLSNGN